MKFIPSFTCTIASVIVLCAASLSAQNTAPTISGIPDQTIGENTTSGPLPFTVGDAETPGSLNVTASSSDQTLVPDSGLSVSPSGTQRTLTVTPAANQRARSTIITLTVSDGEFLTSTNFSLYVDATPVVLPVPLPDLVLGENTPSDPILFTIGDVDTVVFDLTVRATSTNQVLVPDGNLQITEDPNPFKRSLTITPAPNQRGVTKIIVSVRDAHTTNTTTLSVSVNAYPTISTITDRAVPENGTTGPIAFIVGDPDTPVTNLTASGVSSDKLLVPDVNVLTGGTNAARTVTVTPAINFAGQATITVAVSDGQLTTRTNFLVTVTPAGPTTTDGLVQLSNTNGVGDATASLTVTNGVLMAEQVSSVNSAFLRSAWYASSRARTAGYIVSADFLPGENYPNDQRGGVIGWLDLISKKGIVFTMKPGALDGYFQVSVIDFAAATPSGVDGFTGLFETNGVAANPLTARSGLDNYIPSVFATFQLEIAPPSAADRAQTNATAHLYARAFQGGNQVGQTIELLTNLPVPAPANHVVGYFASQYAFQDGFVLRPIGYLDNLRLLEPALSITRGAGDVTVSWPAAFTGYGLQTNSSVVGGSWAPVSLTGPNRATVPSTQPAKFFRLGQP